MGGGHSDPAPVQHCGATISIDGSANVNLKGAHLGGSGCTQHTKSSATGATVKTGIDPTITLPSAKSEELMNMLAMNGIDLSAIKKIVVAKTTNLNPGVNVANHTNTNPGVLIADKSMLWSQQPGVKFFNDTFENASAKYYNAVLQNPGV